MMEMMDFTVNAASFTVNLDRAMFCGGRRCQGFRDGNGRIAIGALSLVRVDLG